MLLHRSTLPAAARHPPRHRPLVEAKRRDNRLRRTAVGKQCHHQGDGLSRSAQPVKRSALAGAERLAALGAEEAPVLARVHANIPLTDLASSRTCQVGAECRGGVHDCPRSIVGERTKRSMSGPPLCLQVPLTTVACGATLYLP